MSPSSSGTIGEHDVGPAPAFVAARGVGDRARDERTEQQADRLRRASTASTRAPGPGSGYVSVSSEPNTGTE